MAAVLLVAGMAAPAWSPGGFPNQLGQTPPRGWRSWQAVAGEVNQSFMEQVMDGLAKPRPLGPEGALRSLAGAGYSDVGLDAGYFRNIGVNGSCHGPEHHLIIDTDRFPIQREKQWPLPGMQSAATVSVSVQDLQTIGNLSSRCSIG